MTKTEKSYFAELGHGMNHRILLLFLLMETPSSLLVKWDCISWAAFAIYSVGFM
jgi:hypothetical protein